MHTINLEIKINDTVQADVEISHLITAINDQPITGRWSYIAEILNGINTDISELTPAQRDIVKKFLQSKLELFNRNNHGKVNI